MPDDAPGTPRVKLPSKAPTQRLGSFSKVTVPAAFDGPTCPGIRGAPVPPPQPPPQQAQRQDEITKADTPTSQSSRMRAIADERVTACQGCQRREWQLRVALGVAIVGAAATICTTGMTLWSQHTEAHVSARHGDRMEKRLIGVQRQLNRLYTRLGDLEDAQRRDKRDIERHRRHPKA